MTPTAQSSRRSSAAVRALAVLVFAALACFAATAQKKLEPGQRVELNAATVAQLERVPGIGPATAKAIVQVREKSGHYQRVEDLLAIHGVSQAKFEKMKPYLYVSLPGAK